MVTPAVWLRDRAKSYARDAELLRSNGDTDDALVFEAIRDELRKCADEVPSVSRDLDCEGDIDHAIGHLLAENAEKAMWRESEA